MLHYFISNILFSLIWLFENCLVYVSVETSTCCWGCSNFQQTDALEWSIGIFFDLFCPQYYPNCIFSNANFWANLANSSEYNQLDGGNWSDLESKSSKDRFVEKIFCKFQKIITLFLFKCLNIILIWNYWT